MAKTSDDRLKAALRENLKRRKGQARARASVADERGIKGTRADEARPEVADASKESDA